MEITLNGCCMTAGFTTDLVAVESSAVDVLLTGAVLGVVTSDEEDVAASLCVDFFVSASDDESSGFGDGELSVEIGGSVCLECFVASNSEFAFVVVALFGSYFCICRR